MSEWYAEAGSEATARRWFLPQHLITWPNGQLSAAARNGDFATNLRRWYDDYFDIILDHLSRIPQLFPTLHAPRDMFYLCPGLSDADCGL